MFVVRPTAAIPALILLAACSEYGVQQKATAPGADSAPEGTPDIAVLPGSVDFGQIAPADQGAQTVRVRNDGDADLTLSDRLELLGDAFSVSALEATLLAPGEETALIVTFTPGDAPEGSGTQTGGTLRISSDDPDEPVVTVPLSGGLPTPGAPDISLTPQSHDFGTLEPGAVAAQDLLLQNTGDAPLSLSALTWASPSAEFLLSGDLSPGTLAPGETRTITVTYAPADDQPDAGTLTVLSDDPDEPSVSSDLYGDGRLFPGFATGWYIVDDSTNYETVSNAAYQVDYHGDSDGYWYEPSGAHGLVGSADPVADFATLRAYVIARAGAPTPVTGPLTFSSSSTVPALSSASYSYIVCDFWIDPAEDPAIYEVSTGTVDDGVRVIVNGTVLGDVILSGSGRFSLAGVGVPGAVNTLAVILMDNAAVNKYVNDLAFWRGGVIVSG